MYNTGLHELTFVMVVIALIEWTEVQTGIF